MRFTVVFDSDTSIPLAYGLVFIPGPCWVTYNTPTALMDAVLVNMSDHPAFPEGGVPRLLDAVEGLRSITSGHPKVMLIVHANGHGTEEDLNELIRGLVTAGFIPQIVTISAEDLTRV